MGMSPSASVLFEVVHARGQPALTSKPLSTSHSAIAMGLAPGSGQKALARSRKSPFYHSGVPHHCGCGQVNLIFWEHQSLFICEMDFFYKISVFQPFFPLVSELAKKRLLIIIFKVLVFCLFFFCLFVFYYSIYSRELFMQGWA